MTAKLHRQPKRIMTKATSGTPITFENLAEASNMAVARARSLLGNQWPVALATVGKEGDSTVPRKMRAARIPPNPPATAMKIEATLQSRAPMRPIRVAPTLSTRRPIGIWRAA